MSIDLSGIKTSIKSLFDTANTTTATQDLSATIANRVQKVVVLNPSRLPIQASWFPAVAIFTAGKDIQDRDIARSQLNAKRLAVVDFKICGIVWNSSVLDPTKDPSDNDCETLMENIEQILRANETLSGSVTWAYPSAVTYHQQNIDEQTNLRAGVMNLRAKILY